MQLSPTFLKNLTWVFLIFLVIFSPSSFAIRDSEIRLICGSQKQVDNSTSSNSFIQNFVTVMDSIQDQICFHNWGSESITSSSPKLYAFAQCHSDLSHLDCKLCFSQGRIKVPRCLPSTSVRIYLDGCFIRYDTYSFFHESNDPAYDAVACGKQPGVSTNRFLQMEFNERVAKTIDNVTEIATKNGSFGVMEAKGKGVPIYTLAQCWNTLNTEECRKCLVDAGSDLKQCAPASEGSALFAGCYIKYSTQRFFNSTVESKAHNHDRTTIIVAIALSAVLFVVFISLGAYIGYERLSKTKEDPNNLGRHPATSSWNFKYEVLEKATEFFDESRKLGQGGAASVFRGTLPDGRTVAVKRLIYNTRQWADQFFNEVNLIRGIQHNNLVKLLGCSIEGPESLLVYEYVPNRSLDKILFMKNTIHILSWQQRFNIIVGTAQGLAYLHGGSGVTIIHRDIKTSNVLLDENLTPKIADFGLARCVATDKTNISTGIAGTLGYMAPEYLVRGVLTDKADVYGFGVLVLEVASGRKNSVFSQGSSSILHSVWKHYKANTITDTIDPGLEGRFSEEQAANVLQIGLLCTQASPKLRPSMDEVVQMLTNVECEIPSPKQPPFLNASVLSPDNNSTESCITRVSLTYSSVIDQHNFAQEALSDTQNSNTAESLASRSSPASINTAQR